MLAVALSACSGTAAVQATPTVVPYDGILPPLEFVDPHELPITYAHGTERVTLNADGSGRVEDLTVWLDCSTGSSFVADGPIAWGMRYPVIGAFYYPERGLAQYVDFWVDGDGIPAVNLRVPACDDTTQVNRTFTRVSE